MSPKQPAKKSVRPAARKTPAKRSKSAAVPNIPTVYDRLHALLHSVRTIAHFEDSLCVLLEHVKREKVGSGGDLQPDTTHELLELLEKLPSHLYLQDLEALRAALPEPRRTAPAKSAKRAPVKHSR